MYHLELNVEPLERRSTSRSASIKVHPIIPGPDGMNIVANVLSTKKTIPSAVNQPTSIVNPIAQVPANSSLGKAILGIQRANRTEIPGSGPPSDSSSSSSSSSSDSSGDGSDSEGSKKRRKNNQRVIE